MPTVSDLRVVGRMPRCTVSLVMFVAIGTLFTLHASFVNRKREWTYINSKQVSVNNFFQLVDETRIGYALFPLLVSTNCRRQQFYQHQRITHGPAWAHVSGL